MFDHITKLICDPIVWKTALQVAEEVKKLRAQDLAPQSWNRDDAMQPACESILRFTAQVDSLLQGCSQAWARWPPAVKDDLERKRDLLVCLLGHLNRFFERVPPTSPLYAHGLFGVCALVIWRTGADLEMVFEQMDFAAIVNVVKGHWMGEAMSRVCERAMSFAGEASTMFLRNIYAAAAPDSAVTFNIGSFMHLYAELLAKLQSSDPAAGTVSTTVADSLCAFIRNAHLISTRNTYCAPQASKPKLTNPNRGKGKQNEDEDADGDQDGDADAGDQAEEVPVDAADSAEPGPSTATVAAKPLDKARLERIRASVARVQALSNTGSVQASTSASVAKPPPSPVQAPANQGQGQTAVDSVPASAN